MGVGAGCNKLYLDHSKPTAYMSFQAIAPYGLSGEFATIADLSVGAVAQHFTKNIGGEPDPVNNISRVGFVSAALMLKWWW